MDIKQYENVNHERHTRQCTKGLGETVINVSERGHYCTTSSQTNFAVPNQKR